MQFIYVILFLKKNVTVMFVFFIYLLSTQIISVILKKLLVYVQRYIYIYICYFLGEVVLRFVEEINVLHLVKLWSRLGHRFL